MFVCMFASCMYVLYDQNILYVHVRMYICMRVFYVCLRLCILVYICAHVCMNVSLYIHSAYGAYPQGNGIYGKKIQDQFRWATG